MLTIRLQRTGKKNRPEFRIVLAEKKAAAGKKFVEILGSYNPRTKAFAIKDQERLTYWVSQHVELSPTAHNLLVSHKMLEAKKVKAFNVPKKKEEPAPAAPAPEAVATEAPAAEAAPESAVEAAAPEAPASETPVESAA